MVGQAKNLEEFAIQVVQRLRAAGFTAYFAGGCVRDRLLAVTPKDYDIATNAVPGQIRDLFGKRRTLAIGASFGVVTVLGPKHIGQIEVATFRSDGIYSDGRHPDNVVFSSPEEDAARRDFTINGMFFDPLTGKIIDFVHGQEDLNSKLIRSIGNPHERIVEDRLRMLRAVRFAATYAFEIEKETLDTIKQHSADIVSVSQERITSEIERMLCHSSRSRSIALLTASGLLEQVLPELAALAMEDAQRWSRIQAVVDSLFRPDFAILIAAFFGSEGAGLTLDGISKVCRRLKVSNELRKTALWIAENLVTLTHTEDLPFSRLQPLLIHGNSEALLTLATSIAAVDDDLRTAKTVEACREFLSLPAERLNPPPVLNGGDLISLSIDPGPIYAEILAAVRSAQLDGKVSTKAEAIDLARSLASAAHGHSKLRSPER